LIRPVTLSEPDEEEVPSTHLTNTDPAHRDRGFLYSLEYDPHSTVTDFARFRGWSTSVPRKIAMW
jgi:hypothetical protein